MSSDLKTIEINCDSKNLIDINNFKELQGNLKELSEINFNKLRSSILEFGFISPFFAWKDNDTYWIIDAHQRFKVLKHLASEGYVVPALPTVLIKAETKQIAKQILLLINTRYGKMTNEGLYEFLNEKDLEINFEDIKEFLDFPEIDFNNLDFNMVLEDDLDNYEQRDLPINSLRDRFIIPPFSIFDSRQGYWQNRKRQWIDYGISSQEGREDSLVMGKSAQSTAIFELRNRMRLKSGNDPSWEEILKEANRRGIHVYTGTSIFDPVLTEIIYSWFNVPGGMILDPFSGGSVRGIVAGVRGYKYMGIDIRQEQNDTNIKQLESLNISNVEWITGDSINLNDLLPEDVQFDLVFSCPPYFDLEVYSKLEGDISNMEYDEFLKAYSEIILLSCNKLKENRFACFVVGDIRDNNGIYRNFISNTIEAFQKAGLCLYNEMILINVAGSLPIRVTKQMENRKVGKMHQNVLVFYKGNTKDIKSHFEIIDFSNEDLSKFGINEIDNQIETLQ